MNCPSTGEFSGPCPLGDDLRRTGGVYCFWLSRFSPITRDLVSESIAGVVCVCLSHGIRAVQSS